MTSYQVQEGTGWLNPSRETKFSGTHGDRGILIFPVQLTTSRIGNLTRLIHTLLYVMTIHTYILHTRKEDQCEWHRMTRMTGPVRTVMCNLILKKHAHTLLTILYKTAIITTSIRSLLRRLFFHALPTTHMWFPFVYFALVVFCFLVFFSESLPGDDVLSLQATLKFTSASFCLLFFPVCFFCFVFSDRVRSRFVFKEKSERI